MATYEIRSERNYAPKVIRVRNLIELPGLDNLRESKDLDRGEEVLS